MKFVIGLMVCCFLVCGHTLDVSPSLADYHETIPGSDQMIAMVAIPGGKYQMGSRINEPGRSSDEGPVHEVSINAFWMAKYETTWDLYRLFVERSIDGSQPEVPSGAEVRLDVDGISGATTPYVDMSFGMGTDGYPAISMTHKAASKFCEWLSAMTGNFYRLATEAEWEYACRAGTSGAYHFNGGSLEQYAWSQENSLDKYHKVGTKRPNAWGLHDMHGNVAEWTLDQYKADGYEKRANQVTSNPYIVPDKTYPRVVRGGSWRDAAIKLRSAARLPSSKVWKARDPQIPKSQWWHTDAPFVGFRIVRPADTPSSQEQRIYWGYQD